MSHILWVIDYDKILTRKLVCKPKNRKWRQNSSTSFLRMQKFSWLQMVVARWTWENMHSENTMWCSCRKHSLGKSKFHFISLDLKLTSLDLNVTFLSSKMHSLETKLSARIISSSMLDFSSLQMVSKKTSLMDGHSLSLQIIKFVAPR